MANTPSVVGTVATLWRYPVKSMQGEELNAADVTPRGLLGDRAFALVDSADGKIVSAKNPRKWPALFDYRAQFYMAPRPDAPLPPIWVTFPDGNRVSSEQANINQLLSQALDRDVTLQSGPPQRPVLEEYWPDIEGLDHRDKVTDETMATGTFFDSAVVHLLSTATIDHLHGLYPAGRFEVRRFRPNLVVASEPSAKGFQEDEWVGRVVGVGDTVKLRVTGPCPRCVMITLPQADLPHDPGVLRTAAQHHKGRVGVYARVEQGGVLRRGDAARLLD